MALPSNTVIVSGPQHSSKYRYKNNGENKFLSIKDSVNIRVRKCRDNGVRLLSLKEAGLFNHVIPCSGFQQETAFPPG